MNEQELFHQVLLLPSEDRSVFLDNACAGNPALRESVAALLRAHEEASSFLEQPPAGIDITIERPEADTAPGTVVAGRYKLLEQIGEGGMGTVWVAEQTEPVKRRVALKLVKPGMDSKSVLARFEAERQALALMDHQNIARVFDGGVTELGRPFFVMELVKGTPLTEYCDARRLSVRERLDLFMQICLAVQHAHQKGIIHRDLKPSNILVTEHDGRPVPKVIDFGLAKALSGATTLTERTLHTAFGATVGTPLYMAPEQVGVNALDVDTRTDVYSLGVILYELLTGTTPLEKKRFKEAAWDEIRRVIREEEPPKPSTRLADSRDSLPSISAHRHTEPAALTKLVKGELDWIVMKALEKDRNRRYDTANGFSMDVQRYLADEPVQACPPSTLYRLKKFVRRNKAPVIAAGLILLSLAGGVVGTAWGLVEARRWAKAEKQARDDADEFRKRETDRAEKEKQAKLAVQARLEKALQVASATLGGDHTHTIANLKTLARTYLEAGRFDEALPLFEKAQRLSGTSLGLNHLTTLAASNDLAEAYLASGKLDRAVSLLEETLEVWRFPLNTRRFPLKTGTLNPALEDHSALKFKERLKDDSPPPGDSPWIRTVNDQVLKTRDILAAAYRVAGQPDKHLKLLEEVVTFKIVRHGADHAETRKSANDLMEAYRAAGKPNEALAVLESLLGPRDKMGAGQPPSFVSMHALARAYREAGKWEESTSLLQETAALLEKRRFHHPDAVVIVHSLIHNLELLQRWKEAEAWRRKLVTFVRDRYGDDSTECASELSGLGRYLYLQKRLTEAEAPCREALAIWEKKKPDAQESQRDRSRLAEVLVQQKKYDQAEPLLLQCYETLKRRGTKNPALVTPDSLKGVLARLVQLYDSMGKPNEAAKWRKELEAQPKAAAQSVEAQSRVRMPIQKPPIKP